MNLILYDDDGLPVLDVPNVEKDGLEVVNQNGGVAISGSLRAAISAALHPYWVQAQKAPKKPEPLPVNVKRFSGKPNYRKGLDP